MIPTLPSMADKNPVLNLAKQIHGLSKEKLVEFNAKVNEGKSYADALYETVLNKKDGGSVESLDHDRMKFELMMRKR